MSKDRGKGCDSKDEMKSVLLIRHGQSVFNEKMDLFFDNNADEKFAVEDDPYEWWERRDHYDPFTVDAKLTKKGIDQAVDVGNKIKDLKIDLFVVSPLQRCLETFENIFKVKKDDRTKNVILNPLASERVNSSCDVGSSIVTLKKKFPRFDFSSLKEGSNWHAALSGSSCYEDKFCVVPNMSPPKVMEPLNEFSKRIDKFKLWLRSRPERQICVVCHAVVIHEFTGTWVENCSVTRVHL